MKYFSQLLLTILVLISFTARSAYFENLNGHIDNNCPEWNLARFQNTNDWFTVGVDGSKANGFDYEVAISRDGVDDVWCALVPDRGIENENCHRVNLFTQRPFEKMHSLPAVNDGLHFNDLEMQYDFYLKNIAEITSDEAIDNLQVGSILEILSRHHLGRVVNKYPADKYTITSGVAYFASVNTRTIGELDIIVYDKETCQVVGIGEAKASSTNSRELSLKKAHIQLKRFRDFLNKEKRKSIKSKR